MTKELFLYSSKQCSLCLDMQKELDKICSSRGLSYYTIDVSDDPELKHRYGARLPVLVGGNEEICELIFDVKAFDNYIIAND